MRVLEYFLITILSKLQFADDKGNRYYSARFDNKRFVLYKEATDPGSIPPKYYAWLHHLIKDIKEINTKINLDTDYLIKFDIIKQKPYYFSWAPKK